MASHVQLDNITHKDLKIDTRRSLELGDNVTSTVIFPLEFRQIQSEYPIVFGKKPATGTFEPLALLGLSESENLFLTSAGWDASYIPLMLQRQPFLIGLQATTVDGVPQEDPLVYVDMESPRISDDEGEPVFLEHGGNTPYLEHINSVLLAIHNGHSINEGFSAALTEFDLLEPFSLEVTLDNQSKQKISGFYTINEDALQALAADSLADLHSKGFLENIYMSIASMANLRALIRAKNRRVAAA